MRKNNHSSITDRNLDRLADLLIDEMEAPSLSDRIPDGAHLFHGTYDDLSLTNANLDLASKTLLGMILGYVEPASLCMVFERASGEKSVINLSDEAYKERARAFVELFRKQSQRSAVEQLLSLIHI